MSASPAHPETDTRPWLALGVTLLVQMLASLTLTAPSVLAPAVAPTLDIAPERIGWFVGLAYLSAMLTGLRSGHWVARIGAVGLSQMTMLALALGCAAALTGMGPWLMLAAVLIGGGYGVINPAAAALLTRHAPVRARGLFFSIKQAGVPVGVALSGVLMPLGLYAIGWQLSAVVTALVCLAVGGALFPSVQRLEPGQAWRRSGAAGAPPSDSPPTPAVRGGIAGPGTRGNALWDVLRDPALRRLSISSLIYGATQLCFVTYVVSLLHLEQGQSLALAAGVLAASQVVSTLARIGLGHAADRWIRPDRLLGLLGVAMGAACVGLAALGEAAPTVWIVLVALFCGATTMGWNGVFFAELARLAPRDQVARLSGATQFFTFSGSMTGPVVFSELLRQGGSYSLGYALVAVLPALAGLALLRAAHRGARD